MVGTSNQLVPEMAIDMLGLKPTLWAPFHCKKPPLKCYILPFSMSTVRKWTSCRAIGPLLWLDFMEHPDKRVIYNGTPMT